MYLLDTNTIISYLNASLPISAMLFMHGVVDEFCNVSIISKMEVLGHNFISPAEQKTIETFVAGATVLVIYILPLFLIIFFVSHTKKVFSMPE